MSTASSSSTHLLRIFVNPDYPELVELYKGAVEKHNAKMDQDFPDSGFDLFVPEDEIFYYDSGMRAKLINFQLKTEMQSSVYTGTGGFFDRNKAYYLYARSSISKTPLMLANHVGVVDSGYRGDLIGAFRRFPGDNEGPYLVSQHTRLVQICLPSLAPFKVEMVANLSDLSSTDRGQGGFGSTGK